MMWTLAICAAIAIAACGQAEPVSMNGLEVEYQPSTVVREFTVDCPNRVGPEDVAKDTIALLCERELGGATEGGDPRSNFRLHMLRLFEHPSETEDAGDGSLRVTLFTPEHTLYEFTLQNDAASTCQVEVVLVEVDDDGYDVGRAGSESLELPATSRRDMSFSVSGDRPDLVPRIEAVACTEPRE